MARKQSGSAVPGAAAGKPKRAPIQRSKKARGQAEDSFREMVLQALELAGGAEYLEKLAHEKPTAFLALVSKVLPVQVKAEHDVGKRLAKALAWKPPT